MYSKFKETELNFETTIKTLVEIISLTEETL